MENHHVQWVNQRQMAISNRYVSLPVSIQIYYIGHKIQSLVNIPFWICFTSLSSICWRFTIPKFVGWCSIRTFTIPWIWVNLVAGLEHFLCFPYIGKFIIPIVKLMFFRGVGSTTKQYYIGQNWGVLWSNIRYHIIFIGSRYQTVYHYIPVL